MSGQATQRGAKEPKRGDKANQAGGVIWTAKEYDHVWGSD